MIRLENVHKTYLSDGREFSAVKGVNLHIRKGEIFGIIGLSGAGKSTLIRCMNRLEEPSSGTITIDGVDIMSLNPAQLRRLRKKVAMIFQQFNLLMQKTVAQNVRYPLELSGASRESADRQVKELLGIVGLADKADAYPSQLSGGQKQRVAIARALASHPKVLLCDEATSALDPITTQAILELLQNINRRLGITIVVITHEMAVIRQICTHVAILDGGVVVEEGSVDDVFTHTRSAAGRRLFGFVEEHTRPPETKAPVPMLRIVFDGMRINEPIISELSLRTGIAVNILHADVNLIGEKRYGQMTIERPVNPEDAQALIRMLTEGGIAVQEVNP